MGGEPRASPQRARRGNAPILLAALEPTVRAGQRYLGSSTAIRENPSGRRTACLSFLADRLRPADATRAILDAAAWNRALQQSRFAQIGLLGEMQPEGAIV